MSFSAALEQHARLRPQALALLEGGVELDFETLARKTAALADGLVAAGVTKGDRVLVRLPSSYRGLELLFACARLGAVFVPIDARLLDGEVAARVRDCEPAVVIASLDEYGQLLEGGRRAAGRERQRAAAGSDPLAILYTSGTTGEPKGVVLSYDNFVYSALNQIAEFGLSDRDRALTAAPLHHAGGLLALGLPCLYAGGTMCLSAPEPDAVLDDMSRVAATKAFLAPHLWRALVDREDPASEGAARSLELCATGGEPLPDETVRRMSELLGAEVVESYGLSEGASCVTVLHDVAGSRPAPGCVGRPVRHTAVRLLDEDGGGVASGAVGEIAICGPAVSIGYWGPQRHVDASSSRSGGWLRTGDDGRFDDEGLLHLVGRSKDLILTPAGKVYPSEVERALREHPDVSEVAVVGVSRESGAEDVVAAVVMRDGASVDAAGVVSLGADLLAEFKRPVATVRWDSLPRSASGKVLTQAVRERCARELGAPLR